MEKKRTGWEHYDLEGEMSGANIATLLELFKRENEKFSELCIKYVEEGPKLKQEAYNELSEACTLQNEARQKVALSIAEILTNTKLVRYYETNPQSRNRK